MSRREKIRSVSLASLLAVALSPLMYLQTVAQETVEQDLAFLVGQWKGVSTHHFPRRDDRDPISEDVTFDCKLVLKEAYVLCDTAWTRRDKGTTRTFLIYLNHVESEKALQALYIYDNWPEHGSYLMYAVEDEVSGPNAYLSNHTITDDEDRPIEEQTRWTFDVENGVLVGLEHSHHEHEPAGEWKLAFSFEMNKLSD